MEGDAQREIEQKAKGSWQLAGSGFGVATRFGGVLGSTDLAAFLADLAERDQRALHRARQRGVQLTGAGAAPSRFAGRLLAWPRGIPQGRSIGVISSRLSRNRMQHREWFHALRHLAAELTSRDVLFTAAGMAAAPWLDRLAAWWSRPLVRCELPGWRTTQSGWVRRACSCREWPEHVWPAFLSAEANYHQAAEEHRSDVPLADRWVMEAADEVYVLRLRRNSRLLPALRERLSREQPCVWLAEGGELVERRLAEELQKAGAAIWRPRAFWGRAARREVRDCEPCERQGNILEQPPAGDFLYHCTRRIDGPWPGQTCSEYLDDLLFNRPAADHSPRAALRRMLSEGRIRASAEAIRGGTRVVCFTGVEWCELRRLCRYRPHRVRWDFGSYGIAVDRRWLAARGARQVIYGGDDRWAELPVELRAFFQLRSTRVRRGHVGEPIDWSVEREWRHCGDVPLRELRAEQAFVFVPSRVDAEWLAPFSRWPVVIAEAC